MLNVFIGWLNEELFPQFLYKQTFLLKKKISLPFLTIALFFLYEFLFLFPSFNCQDSPVLSSAHWPLLLTHAPKHHPLSKFYWEDTWYQHTNYLSAVLNVSQLKLRDFTFKLHNYSICCQNQVLLLCCRRAGGFNIFLVPKEEIWEKHLSPSSRPYLITEFADFTT